MPLSFLDPEKILSQIPLTPGMVVSDFGAGSGFFSLAAAKKVGERGTVYAIDIQEPPLEAIRARAKFAGLLHVETIRSDLERPRGSQLEDARCDLVIISQLLSQVGKKEMVLKEAARVLKKGGMLLFIDWVPEKMMSAKGLKPLSKAEAERLVSKSNRFLLEKEIDAGAFHFGFLFKKE